MIWRYGFGPLIMRTKLQNLLIKWSEVYNKTFVGYDKPFDSPE